MDLSICNNLAPYTRTQLPNVDCRSKDLIIANEASFSLSACDLAAEVKVQNILCMRPCGL
jgi:hypothetical protein